MRTSAHRLPGRKRPGRWREAIRILERRAEREAGDWSPADTSPDDEAKPDEAQPDQDPASTTEDRDSRRENDTGRGNQAPGESGEPTRKASGLSDASWFCLP
jgi:hypothetical protein